MKFFKRIAFTCLTAFLICACSAKNPVPQSRVVENSAPIAILPTQTLAAAFQKTDTSSASSAETTTTQPSEKAQAPSICLALLEGSPSMLTSQIDALNELFCHSSGEWNQVNMGKGTGIPLGEWVYAFVAPFPTVTDEIAAASLQDFWQEGTPSGFSILGMTQETARNLEALWGKPAGDIKIVADKALSDWVWQTESARAIVPFENLTPRLKVISLDGISPIQKAFVPEDYALSVPISLEVPDGEDKNLLVSFLQNELPLTNRDPQKMASVILTGVTALVRATAFGMENEGLEKPTEVIGQSLREADITHVSNEASFAADCPDPQDEHLSLKLCSKPAYFEALQVIGTDVVELTGDHLNDWGNQALLDTLAIYQQAGIKTFGGGANSKAASEPALFEVNGNKIAFIGCNSKHVGYPMATATTPGALDCDMDAMASQITDLVQRGYLPIVGIQHTELSSWYPSDRMVREFSQLAQAGAVIVSGSEAHRPQTFNFGGADGNTFLHYGLGNLFFDQDTMGGDYENAFIDHHVFYDGHYISTEVLTIHFPNSLTPVWADTQTRSELLNMFFWTSGLVPSPW